MACVCKSMYNIVRNLVLRSISTSVGRKQDVIDFTDNCDLLVPSYPKKNGETIDVKKARLLYQSRKRGMLENDLLFSTFAAKYLKGMDEKQVELYDNLVTGPSNDWDIYYWATDKKPTPDEYDNEIMDLFKKHVQNVNKEKRLRQPNL